MLHACMYVYMCVLCICMPECMCLHTLNVHTCVTMNEFNHSEYFIVRLLIHKLLCVCVCLSVLWVSVCSLQLNDNQERGL